MDSGGVCRARCARGVSAGIVGTGRDGSSAIADDSDPVRLDGRDPPVELGGMEYWPTPFLLVTMVTSRTAMPLADGPPF